MSVSKEKTDLKSPKKNKEIEYEREFNKIERELFNKYCFKKSYKNHCDPHCVAAYTNTCQYLHELHKIGGKLNFDNGR